MADFIGGGNSSSASASGSAGGGNNTYSTEQGDFTATITDATTNIVLSVDSIGGAAIDENNFGNGILKVWDATNDEMIQITLDDFTWTPATKTLAVANCTGAFTFNTGDVVSLTIVGLDKSYDKLNNAQYANPVRDLSDNYTSDNLVNTTNVASGTKYYLSMDNYKNLAFGGTIIDGAGETTSIQMWGTTVKGSTTATDYVQMHFYDEENNVVVNEISVTNATKYFLCSYEGLGKITDVYFLLTTSAATNTVYLNSKRQY